MEEMGRLPFPGPFFSSAVLATLAARRLGADDLLAPLADGHVARHGGARGAGPRRSRSTACRTRARRKGATWMLNGSKPLVLDGHTADWVIVVGTHRGGPRLVPAPGARRASRSPTLDPTRKAARLVLEDTPVEPIGPLGDHTADLASRRRRRGGDARGRARRRVRRRARAGGRVRRRSACSSTGRSRRSRRSGTRPSTCCTGSSSRVWARTTRRGPPTSTTRHASTRPRWRRASCGEAAVFVTGEDIQIHGGVGFTWDCDAHFYYKRAKQNDTMLGYQGWQRQRLADLVLDPA